MGDTTVVLKYLKEKYREDRKRLLSEVQKDEEQQPQTKPAKHTSLTLEKQTKETHKLFED